tara:strand:+ start:221 stop:424 length:204 start_codon:yes stop_codon:yes gene_type:complete
MKEGRMMGIGPPPHEPAEYTQEEFYCEKCELSFKEETTYNTFVGLYVCVKCEKEVKEDIKKYGNRER